LLAEAQRQVDEQLAQVDRQTAEGQADLLPLLADFAVQLDELVARHASTQRLETEQLGRRLPAGSLFR
jgi:hypothetical protein